MRSTLTLTVIPLLLLAAHAPAASIEKVRLIWGERPTTEAVLAWVQDEDVPGGVHYGPEDAGGDPSAYPLVHPADVSTEVRGMRTRFARLTGLEPDSRYYAVIAAGDGVSRRYWFRTAPAEPDSFTFIAGGDSRNHHDARRNANTMVRKLRPLFVAFGGDMTDKDTDEQWHQWLDDWELTTGEDGLLIPIVAARGNHERRNESVTELFDSPNQDVVFATAIGGDQIRLYTLNSEITAGGSQREWLAQDLEAHPDVRFKLAQYHRPMRPHVSRKQERLKQYRAWAPLFYRHGVALVFESDAHCVKVTWPLRPTTSSGSHEGFVRDDERGTVYVGEGCWGAPLRPADDAKPWTRASGSFNQFKWVNVQPDRMEVHTVQIDNAAEVETVDDAQPHVAPAGLQLWAAPEGATVELRATGSPEAPAEALREAGLVELAPEIAIADRVFEGSTTATITIETELPGSLRYTLDGSDVVPGSQTYADPLTLSDSAVVTAAWVTPDGLVSGQAQVRVTRIPPPLGTRGPQPSVRLSSLEWIEQSAGWGETQRDRSIGKRPLRIGGEVYETGLGTHAEGHVTIAVQADWERFVASVGLNDAAVATARASVRITADGAELYASSELLAPYAVHHIDVAIPEGTQQVTLHVEDGGNGIHWDNVDWVDVGFVAAEPVGAPAE